MPIAEASKEVKEESNNKSAALEFICVDEMTDPSSIIRPLMSHCNSCGIGAIDQAFIQREWERDRQSDRLHWWRFYDPTADPPPPSRRKQIYSRHRHSRSIVRTPEDSFAPPLHCRARRPSLTPPRPSFCLTFILLALRLSPSPHRSRSVCL